MTCAATAATEERKKMGFIAWRECQRKTEESLMDSKVLQNDQTSDAVDFRNASSQLTYRWRYKCFQWQDAS
jgi:hypothetical protein